MPSLVTATWSAWRAAHLPPAGKFAERDLASAIVKLGIRVPRSARTADTLGAEREGTGVLIDDDGLILTIGYLLLEADSVLLVASDGRVMPATIVGFDHATGFGLVRARQPLGGTPLEIGEVSSARELSTLSSRPYATDSSADRKLSLSVSRPTFSMSCPVCLAMISFRRCFRNRISLA